jgi:hypothetical protein
VSGESFKGVTAPRCQTPPLPIDAVGVQIEHLHTMFPQVEEVEHTTQASSPITNLPGTHSSRLSPRRPFALGESEMRRPELLITKEGDESLRWLLVQAAHYILGPFGPDTDLRRWGLRLVARGGMHAKQLGT